MMLRFLTWSAEKHARFSFLLLGSTRLPAGTKYKKYVVAVVAPALPFNRTASTIGSGDLTRLTSEYSHLPARVISEGLHPQSAKAATKMSVVPTSFICGADIVV